MYKKFIIILLITIFHLNAKAKIHILATVEKTIISSYDLEKRIELYIKLYNINNDQNTKKAILNNMIEEQLLLSLAKKINIQAKNEHVAEYIKNINMEKHMLEKNIDHFKLKIIWPHFIKYITDTKINIKKEEMQKFVNANQIYEITQIKIENEKLYTDNITKLENTNCQNIQEIHKLINSTNTELKKIDIQYQDLNENIKNKINNNITKKIIHNISTVNEEKYLVITCPKEQNDNTIFSINAYNELTQKEAKKYIDNYVIKLRRKAVYKNAAY